MPIEETLDALADLVNAGKIRQYRHFQRDRLGRDEYLHAAESSGLPRIVSIQNVYSLLSRHFEHELSEIAHREKSAFSPIPRLRRAISPANTEWRAA